MRKMIFPLVAVCTALVLTGCGPERKLGRGMNNAFEIVRMGEMRRSIEMNAVMEDPSMGYTYGGYSGFHKSLTRATVGVYEVLTFPLPPYGPILTGYIPAKPSFPESYKPGRISDPLFDTDTYTGFSGGDIAPFIPGSRFRVFDN
jgi:putative exosortase-associated protein (TIGR04073 family)